MPDAPTEYASRRAAIAGKLAEAKLDALIVSFLPNVRYLTGFTGSNALLMVSPGRSLILTDPRYTQQVSEEADCPSKVARGSLWKVAAAIIGQRRWKSIGFEAGRTTVEAFQLLQSMLPLGASLQGTSALVESSRTVKSAGEVAQIRESVKTCSKAFDSAMRRFKPGMKEFELAAELDHQMRRLGAEAPAFETIVAAGPRAALPHARPTAAGIDAGHLLLVDMGAMQRGYASDMTRTMHVGSPGAKAKRAYRAVLDAQLAAIAAVRNGITAGAVDRAARTELKRAGYEKAFVHSTGHGLGLEIHESPRLGKGDRTPLRAGMVVTIEPGVYIEGFGGIRIEDTILVTTTGCDVLTPTNKELLAL